MADLINDYFESLTVGEEKCYNNLVIFPVISNDIRSSDFITIDEALHDNGAVSITEVSKAGDVPSLKLRNDTMRKILIMDGEELVGSKQNRVINSIVLTPEEEEIIIPVSCVERNRWNYQTKKFYSCGRRAYLNLRRIIFVLTSSNRTRKLKLHPQHHVWTDIDAKLCRMDVRSATNAMGDIFDQYAKELRMFSDNIKRDARQVGIIAYINNAFVGCEIFSSADALNSFYNKIIYSYAIDAIESYDSKNKVLKTMKRRAVSSFNTIKDCRHEKVDSIGLGTSYLLNSDNMHGSALNYNGEMVYMSLFAKMDQ